VRLRQVLLNLLHNASKFTTAGEIVLGAEVQPPNLHLWVTDSGPGISPEMQERIFEPFVTAEQASRQRSGIGLGLSITRRLVALHSGSIVLDSTLGVGSTFHVYLPLPNLSGQPAKTSGQGERPVLLELSSAEKSSAAINDLCQRQGWSVYRLSPDDKLERILGKVTPVGLAWDMDQATQRDWDLIDQLRRHPQCAQLPFILFGKEQDRETGFTSVLTKPLNGKTFLETLSALRPAAASGLILVVDDDPEAREFYQRILRETLPGHTMQLAENGAEALALMEQTVPNLVVLDLIMPEVDGFTVLERMRANHLTRHVPVLVVSGRGLTLQDVQRLDYARVTFQSKGLLTPEEAIATVQAALTGQTPLPQPTSKLVKRALVYIHQNYHRPLARQDIASAVSVNEDYLSRMFRKEMGLSLWECLTRYRILKAQELLIGADDSIIEVAAQVGFEDSNYFSRVFHQYTGQSPQAYRQQPR